MNIQLTSDGKVYLIGGQPVYTLSLAEKLTNAFLDMVYAETNGIIGAGIRKWVDGLPVGITFDGSGNIDNTTNWYDYNAAKAAVKAEYERLLSETVDGHIKYNVLVYLIGAKMGLQMEYDSGNDTWRIKTAYDLKMVNHFDQTTIDNQPRLLEDGIDKGAYSSGTNWGAVELRRNSLIMMPKNKVKQSYKMKVMPYITLDYLVYHGDVAWAIRRQSANRIIFYLRDSANVIVNTTTNANAFIENDWTDFSTEWDNTTKIAIIERDGLIMREATVNGVKPVQQLHRPIGTAATDELNIIIEKVELLSYD